jgi:hypothetical protein
MLTVDRTQFIEGLRILDGMIKRKHQAKAVLRFTGGVLTIRVANTAVDVDAIGEWPGTAKIAFRMLFTMANSPPTVDPVTLAVEGDRLVIERRWTLCEWVASKHVAPARRR